MRLWEKIFIPGISVLLSITISIYVTSRAVQTSNKEVKRSVYTDVNKELSEIHNRILTISKIQDENAIEIWQKEIPAHNLKLSDLKDHQKYYISDRVVSSLSDYLRYVLSKRDQNKRIKCFDENEISELEELKKSISDAINEDLKIKPFSFRY